MKKYCFIGLIIFLTLSSFGQTNGKNDVSSQNGWKIINENSYTIQYPDSFDLDKSGMMRTSFVLLSKQTSANDLFRENVNLLVQDLNGQNINLEKYTEISENQIKKMLSNCKILESKNIEIADKKYHKIIYTGDQLNYKLKFEQYYFVDKFKAYVLTFTCEINQFENYREVGEKIMNSFKIK